MANFAIAADENVIARGNKLIEELQEPGEKKGVTLNRLFDLVSTHLQEDQLKRSGVDTEALDASITNIRNLFTAALSGKEEIRAEYERRMAELRERNEELEKNYKIQLGKLASEKEDALRKYTDLKELQETAETARKAAEEQAASAVNLVKEKGYDISQIHMDCGIEIFDPQKQGTHAGGSGCGCSAVVFSSYIIDNVRDGKWKRILFIPTGALLSTVSYNEGQSVPGIAHGVIVEHV